MNDMNDRLKAQQTTSLTIDDAVFAVDKMNPAIQQMVAFMDVWRQQEIDLKIELAKTTAALRDIQNNIYVAVKKEREDAMKKARDLGIVPVAPQPGPVANAKPTASNETGEDQGPERA